VGRLLRVIVVTAIEVRKTHGIGISFSLEIATPVPRHTAGDYDLLLGRIFDPVIETVHVDMPWKGSRRNLIRLTLFARHSDRKSLRKGDAVDAQPNLTAALSKIVVYAVKAVNAARRNVDRRVNGSRRCS
jgi:hypothetical protein